MSSLDRVSSVLGFSADVTTQPAVALGDNSPWEGSLSSQHPLPPLPLTTDLPPLSLNASSDTEVTSPSPDDAFLPWDNPHNVISLQTFLTFEEVMTCYVSSGLFLMGAPTNVLNCLVFFRQGLRDRMNLCLFCLALVDLCYVTFFYLVVSHCLVGRLYPGDEVATTQWWKYFTRKYFTGVYRGFLYSSGCLTALISAERCVCVVLPLKAASLVRTRTVAGVILLIVGLVHLASVLYPLHLQIGSRVDPRTGGSTLFLTSSEFYARHRLLYTVVEDTILMVVLPMATFVVVIISTVVTVLELKLRSRWRRMSSAGSEAASLQQVRVVKMLVVVSCIYLLTSAPNVALGLTRSLLPSFHHTRRFANIFLASHLAYLVLAMLNSSVNFFVYLSRSSRFRAHLAAILPCRAARFSASKNRTGPQSGSLGSSRRRFFGFSRLRNVLVAIFCCPVSASVGAGPTVGRGAPASTSGVICVVSDVSDIHECKASN
ncbi:uncharacterized protein LOC143286416 [Babylonia areolata]|uniref:uncharacterized protein LOC143286416 n=1 Tax=Babylonia areolata TaxID=304850 RepID=UPI003FD05F8C